MVSREQTFVDMLSSDVELAYDVETNGLNWHTGYVCGYSLSDGKTAVYVPVRHEGGGNIADPAGFEAKVAELFKARKAATIGHNLKFDIHFSHIHGIELGANIVDTMVTEALLNEFRRSYSLESVSKSYEGIVPKKGADLYAHIAKGMGVKATQKETMPLFYKMAGDDPVIVDYAAGDTLTTFQLYQKQKKEIYAQNLENVFELEHKLLPVLVKMERVGIKINKQVLAEVQERFAKEQLAAYGKLPLKDDMTPMNIRSSKDLQEYFTFHGITDWPMTDKGNPSLNKTFMGEHDVGDDILTARKIDHLKNSFLDVIDKYIHGTRIHTNFNQTMGEFGGTKTGRLSCREPNLQQVPKRDEYLGKIYRSIFEADAGFTLVEFDYSQAEPRLFAHYSKEPVLMDGYSAEPPIDMHTVAARLMGIDRKVAKSLNLGMQYAMGVKKLGMALGISEGEAKEIARQWYATFPNVRKFTRGAAKVAEDRGHVRTILGRRARFDDPNFSYKAANRIVQGGSSDILKLKLIQLDKWITEGGLSKDIVMLLNIHDAILFMVRDNVLDFAIPSIKTIMEDVNGYPFNLRVPFVVEFTTGKTWSEATYKTEHTHGFLNGAVESENRQGDSAEVLDQSNFY